MFNICVIGCGDLGTQHAKAWKSRSDCRVVAVADPIEERRTKLAEMVGAKAFAKNEDAIAYAGVDIVSVCIPNTFHAEATCLAAGAGKHVLSEKPIALTLAQADEMIETTRKHKVQFSVSLQYRAFSRQIQYRKLCREGAFGGPVMLRFLDIREVRPKLAMHQKHMNGGPLVDMAAHIFDLMRFYTGAEPVRIYAQGHVYGKGKPRLASIPERDLAIDAATLDVTFQHGHQLHAMINWGMPEGFPTFGEHHIFGPLLSAKTTDAGIEISRGNGQNETIAVDPDPIGPAVRIDDLIKAIKGEKPLEVTGDDGRIALKCSLAALESIESGRVVQF